MTRFSWRQGMRILASVLGVLAVVGAAAPSRSAAQSAPPALYAAIGDSIDFGLGDDNLADGFGYPPLLQTFLTMALGQPVELRNFAMVGAQVRDIWQDQLPAAVAALHGRAPVVVTWGGGGNDLAEVVTGPQVATCRRAQSCLGRLNALLNEVEQTIDHTIRELRDAVGPEGRILMRTQYNALLRAGCAPTPEAAVLGNVTLEGAPGTVLDRGLNTRIRSIAQKYDAGVIDTFVPFALSPNTLVSTDCAHPSALGHRMIAFLASLAF